MRNWQRWALAIVLPFAVGSLQAFEEGTALMDALRHGVHSLLPSLLALKMTLNQNESSADVTRGQ